MKSKSPLTLLIFILLTIGTIAISLSSFNEADQVINDKFFFLKKHLLWIGVGTIIYFLCSKINFSFFEKISSPIYFLSLIFLIIVLLPKLGSQALGARRWLNFGFLNFQPSELLKFTSILYFSFLFSQKTKRNFRTLLFYVSLNFILVILEPNLSTAILIAATTISIFFLARGSLDDLVKLAAIFVGAIVLLVITSHYRLSRFFDSYHKEQIILALASGGLFGQGLANSSQKFFIPKLTTDSILSIIGEETGFIGIVVVLFVYLSLISYLFKLGQTIHQPVLSLFILATGCWLSYQTLINLAAISGLIPLTGVPLPFISYGGSSLIVLLAATGLVKNIETHHL